MQVSATNTLNFISNKHIWVHVSVFRVTITLILCSGGPSDAPSPDFHQLSSPLHPQRPEALWQQAAHAQVYPGTKCSHIETGRTWQKSLSELLLFIFFPLQTFCLQEVQKRFPDGVPLLDPIDDMGIKDPALKKVIQKVEAFEHRMYSHPLHSDPNLESVYSLCEKKALVRSCIFVSFSLGELKVSHRKP